MRGDLSPWFVALSILCLVYGCFVIEGCGPGGSFDKRHYDCQGNGDKMAAVVQSGRSISEARTMYCREIFPPCKDSIGAE